ncbi:MAG: metallophosphoesterase [Mogibacterium sp.]|nr:metallophosphoesterase [Mogibacterium sp.]
MKKRKKQLLTVLVLLAMLLAGLALLFSLHRAAGDAGAPEEAAQLQDDAGASGIINDGEGAEKAEENGTDGSRALAVLCFVSDYQTEPGWNTPEDNLKALLRSVKNEGRSPDMLVMCGDYTNDAVLHDYQLSPEESIAEIRRTAETEFPQLTGDKLLFVQGNHDKLTESVSESGLHEFDDCLIYVLNTENDFPWKQGKTAGCLKKVRKAAADMKKCFDGLIKKGETRPVFIAGHVPLHFTARTSSRHTTGDNLYSPLIFDVVNEAAGSLDIVYLYGHNHSKGWDCYMGGSSVFKAAGDTVLIPAFDADRITADSYMEEKLKFTYLNAGYTGYFMNCGPEELALGKADDYSAADETLTCTVCEVYTDWLVLSRYDADGVHCLGHEGEGDPYKGGIDKGLIDEKDYAIEVSSPQTIGRKPAE